MDQSNADREKHGAGAGSIGRPRRRLGRAWTRRLWWPALAGALGLAVAVGGAPGVVPQEAEAAGDAALYGDGLASGWRNWSWKSTVNFGATPGYNGSSRSISWRVDGAYGGLYLHTATGTPTSSSTRLQFALRASQADQRFRVGLYDASGTLLVSKRLSEVGGDPPAGAWKLYDIGLGTLGAAGRTITGLQLQDAENATQPAVLVDAVKLVDIGAATSSAPPNPTSSPPATATPPTPTPSPVTPTPTYAAQLGNVIVNGGDVSADVTLQSSQPGTVLVDLLAYQNGAKIKEAYRRGVASGQTVRLTINGLSAGTYDLTVGLFTDDADWAPQLGWFSKIATATVQAAAPPAPSPTPSGSTPTPSPTPSPVTPAGYEHRPANTVANNTRAKPAAWVPGWPSYIRDYYNRIDGQFTGTTEQILEHYADKWFPEYAGGQYVSQLGGSFHDLFKAVAHKESTWRQAARGDNQSATYYYSPHPSYPSPDYQTYSIMQIKRTTWPGTFDACSVRSTPCSVDYYGAILRHVFDGRSWQGAKVAGVGNIWAAVAAWYGDSNPNGTYATLVKEYVRTKPWTRPGY